MRSYLRTTSTGSSRSMSPAAEFTASSAFRSRFPRATLTVVEGLSAYMLEWVLIGRLDCAVVYNVSPASSIDLLPVLEIRGGTLEETVPSEHT